MKCCIDQEDLELFCHVILSIALTLPIRRFRVLQSCDILCCFDSISQSQGSEFSSHVIYYVALTGSANHKAQSSHSHHVIYGVALVALTDYQYGVRLVSGVNNKVLITLNARNDHDRQKFVEDLREAILEVRLVMKA